MHDAGVKRDLKKVTIGMNKRYTLEAAEKLKGSELPSCSWAPGDPLFPITTPSVWPPETPNARIVLIPDASTFVPVDQPGRWPTRSRTVIRPAARR